MFDPPDFFFSLRGALHVLILNESCIEMDNAMVKCLSPSSAKYFESGFPAMFDNGEVGEKIIIQLEVKNNQPCMYRQATIFLGVVSPSESCLHTPKSMYISFYLAFSISTALVVLSNFVHDIKTNKSI
jgi:hypothetical protein